MASWLIWLVTAEYLVAAGLLVNQQQFAQATMLYGYAIANIGLLWSIHVR